MAPLPLADVDKPEDEKTFQAAFATVNALVESLRTYRAGRCLAAKGDDKLVVGGFARYDGGQEGEEEILRFEKLARALNKAGSFGICGKRGCEGLPKSAMTGMKKVF